MNKVSQTYCVMEIDINNELPKRKPTRLKDFDYSKTGAYFVTICTRDRKQILSRIVGGDVLDAPLSLELLPCGKIADKYVNQLNIFYDHLSVDRYVIMPNHIHMILIVFNDGASRTSPPTKQHSVVSQFVSTFKRFCNKEIGNNIFQRGYFDHVMRDQEDYEKHVKYIYENPIRWYYKHLNMTD